MPTASSLSPDEQSAAEPRRLLVVLYADMAGYSRLIGRDDAGTFLRLRRLRRSVIDPALAGNGGTLRQTAGDSFLVIFDSIDGAVEAALAIQRGVAAGDTDKEMPMRFRIGINLGDAILDTSDMHGDGVNVAVRLQTVCPPGRICVSRAIRDHARRRDDVRFESLGSIALKNIDTPVEAYLLRAADPQPGLVSRAWAAIPLRRVRRGTAAVLAAVPVAALLAILALTYRGAEVPLAQREEAARAQTRHAEEMRQLAALSDAQRTLADTMARDKGVPLPVIVRILARLGETVPQDPDDAADVQKRLEEKAGEFLALRQQLERIEGADPAVSELRALADAALARADFPRAEQALRQAAGIELAATTSLAARAQERARAAAGLFEKSAGVASVALRYRDAAADLSRAADAIAPFDKHEQWRLDLERGRVLTARGNQFGDNAALVEAIGVYTRALTLVPRAEAPLDWAQTQNRMAWAEYHLGRRETSGARLESAAAHFRAAIEEQTFARTPADWVDSQDGLGNTLWRLGDRETGTARLEEAATVYRGALPVVSRDAAPTDWARLENDLGLVLMYLARRQSGTASGEDALAAFRAALEIRTRDRAPSAWAETQNNLCVLDRDLGGGGARTKRLEDALAACRAALEVRTRDRSPLQWALSQDNLGRVLLALGIREDATSHIEAAVAAYRAALEERTRERGPLDWATSESNLGNALFALGRRQGNTALEREAVAAYRAALEERPLDRFPVAFASTQNALGNLLQTIARQENNPELGAEAAAAYRAALQGWTRDRSPLAWANVEVSLGYTLWEFPPREDDAAHLEEAEAAFRAALVEWTRDRDVAQWANASNGLGLVLLRLGERTGDAARLREAIGIYRTVKAAMPNDQSFLVLFTSNNLGVALTSLGAREGDTAALEEAAATFRSLLTPGLRQTAPLIWWSRFEDHLGRALAALGEREAGTARLEEAVADYRSALEERRRENGPLDWAMTEEGLGVALAALAQREPGTARLEDAAAAFTACLTVAETAWPAGRVREVADRRAAVRAEIALRTTAPR